MLSSRPSALVPTSHAPTLLARVALGTLVSLLPLLWAAPTPARAAGAATPTEQVKSAPALDLQAFDKQANACEDFYQYACGGWIAKTEIPADRSGWSRGFFALAKSNEDLMKKILERDAAATDAQGEQRQLGDFFATCSDEAKAETASMATLQRRLATLGTIKDGHALAVQVARAHMSGANAFFNFGSDQDAKDSSLMIASADQGGLSLPDRDYYLSKEARMVTIRKAYVDHVRTMFTLLGEPAAKAAQDAATVLRIETALAKVAMDRVERRDPTKTYHRLERTGLVKLSPHFAWDAYLTGIGLPRVQAVNVAVPDFFSGLDTLLRTTKIADLQTYLRWQTLSGASSMLAKRFVDEDFAFSSKAFSGQKAQEPRWKRCVNMTVHMLSHPAGKAYVEAAFRGDSKTKAQALIKGVEAAFGRDLQNISWMDAPTRQQADAKLGTLVNQIGYPDTWRDYSGLKIGRVSYLDNVWAGIEFESRFDLAKIGKPVDRREWGMNASTVNAYYSPENNKMVFPAGILQPPFFNDTAPDAVNYGAIGMVMGHELTHGFDDQGRRYDASGNLRDWWTPEVGTKFDQGATCLVNQYSSYVPIDNIHVNGKMTLGENIADQGGIQLAYAAWQATGAKGEALDGFTPAQQFFLGYAQAWCTTLRPERVRLAATVDPHSPPHFRVNGPLANFPEFAKAFSCKEGTPMAPKDRCKIW